MPCEGWCEAGHLSLNRARDALRDLDDLHVQCWPLRHPFAVRALDLGASLTAYDAAYVVVAEGIDAPLVTRDGRLARDAAQRHRRHRAVKV